MPTETPERHDARFRPHASGDMAAMFDQVSPHYDLLNTILSLGRDAAWRRAMTYAVPHDAHVVLDLCAGNGVSLAGLRGPGRLVIGIDVSLGMLHAAAEAERRTGWAPRLVCADAFRLPLRDRSLDAVTIAFGMRNLRPHTDAVKELARVLAPGGKLVVLEACGPARGLLAPLHRFYLRQVVPLAGRISPDPTAYRYLGASILEFGVGESFEAALREHGFDIEAKRGFMAGASRLWVARRRTSIGQFAAIRPNPLQSATGPRGSGATPRALESEWRTWTGVQAVVSVSLLGGLLYAARTLAISGAALPLEPWQRRGGWVLLIAAIVAFAFRSLVLAGRLLRGRPKS
jgi:demethylmenaquinone methyltransferase/2-methoxy-6-polyprenyl-1,4-benzoquinol methylase